MHPLDSFLPPSPLCLGYMHYVHIFCHFLHFFKMLFFHDETTKDAFMFWKKKRFTTWKSDFNPLASFHSYCATVVFVICREHLDVLSLLSDYICLCKIKIDLPKRYYIMLLQFRKKICFRITFVTLFVRQSVSQFSPGWRWHGWLIEWLDL